MKTKRIHIISTYKDVFVSQADCVPYRSGMDKELLKKHFNEAGFEVNLLQFSYIDIRNMNFEDEYVLYTSTEDVGYYYKSYIEDIILGLQLQGAKLIPEFKYLRANNNKVFMEILRDAFDDTEIRTLKSFKIGVLEDIYKYENELRKWDKYVIKTAEGAMSTGVSLANNFDDLIKKAKKISRTFYLYQDLKDIARKYYFKGYKLESRYRKKFIIQQFIPNLQNDWKVLVYWDKIFILKRYVRKNDFRSSGSGNFVVDQDFPIEILDYAFEIREKLDLPNISLDICYSDEKFYLIEFQAINFGTSTILLSPFYYKKNVNSWDCVTEKQSIVEVYAYSIVNYINTKSNYGQLST